MKYNNEIKSFELVKTNDWPDYDLKITLKPSFRCNHKCWFCTEYSNKTKTWTIEQCDQVLKKLKEKHKNVVNLDGDIIRDLFDIFLELTKLYAVP